jgi:Family of unknown function (DUF6338)
VIPQSVAALAGFLLLVAPGLTYELLRERERPTIEASTFREASRVALTSLVFTTVSLLVLIALASIFPSLLDLDGWIDGGDRYVKEHYRVFGGAVVAQLVISCGLAVGASAVINGGLRVRNRPVSAWYRTLYEKAPADTIPFLTVALNDGTRYSGRLVRSSIDHKIADRELVIGPPILYQHSPDADPVPLEELEALILQATSITSVGITYVDKAAYVARADGPA